MSTFLFAYTINKLIIKLVNDFSASVAVGSIVFVAVQFEKAAGHSTRWWWQSEKVRAGWEMDKVRETGEALDGEGLTVNGERRKEKGARTNSESAFCLRTFRLVKFFCAIGSYEKNAFAGGSLAHRQ